MSNYICVDGDCDATNEQVFKSVCSIKDGTSFCDDAKSFQTFYTQPPPVCDNNNVCYSTKATKHDIERIYSTFVSYLGNILLTKVKDNRTHSIYAIRVATGLLIENQFIFAITVRDRLRLGTAVNLSDIKWESLQFRKIDKGPALNPTAVGGNKDSLDMKAEIGLISRNDDFSQYKCDSLPIVITLLHTKKDTQNQYSKKGTLRLAINEYQTIITF